MARTFEQAQMVLSLLQASAGAQTYREETTSPPKAEPDWVGELSADLEPLPWGSKGPRTRRGAAYPGLARACPRCKAGPGEECDPKTLGARRFHEARISAIPL